MVDSSSNQYLYFALTGDDKNIHLAKRSSNGTELWVKEYSGFYSVLSKKITFLSEDESIIRILGESLTDKMQFTEISTVNGSVLNSYVTTGSSRLTTFSYQSNLDCSKVTKTVCYYIARASSSTPHYISKVDFSSLSTINHFSVIPTNFLTNIHAINDIEAIIASFDKEFTNALHCFYRFNFTLGDFVWEFRTTPLEVSFNVDEGRSTFSHLNDALTKYYSIYQQNASSVIFVLNPADGNLTEVKHITYPQSVTGSQPTYCGRLSDNQIIVSFSSTGYDYQFIDIINTDTWEQISYSSTYLILISASPIFNSNQVILSFGTSSTAGLFSMQAAYDMLNFTEVFTQSTHNLTDVTSNYTIMDFDDNFNTGSESAQALTITAANATLDTDTDKSYKVNVNIFSDSMETYNGTVNDTTPIGPLKFDCYDVVTATNANFTNQLTFATKDGSSMASWMSFDSAAGNVSISIPSEVSSDNFTITNTYTGVLGNNFTLATDLTINIVEAQVVPNNSNTNTNTNTNEDDH